ncbi:hypothetical protein HS088_TW21G00350 [Tripterygium wilfordii]|uniref:Biogenesis of lysosome-related organelles complex 1 subunit 7 n=1 Tax=Tripterygium wilfordii TaxID=458696 RepID=A0A7J7C2P9_TRIWF|nr:uncharacterized protein LOC119989776 [Tripterygium wilfordii]KAF5728205.1 hypothetical protein HS088_TW21G00350 [Tripterygium wilfordii]
MEASPENNRDSKGEIVDSVTTNIDGEEHDDRQQSKLVSDGETTNPGSTDALAKGLSSMLATVIRDFDTKAQSTTESQDTLASAIDRLTIELDQLLEDAPLPFIMQHAAKISGVRKRVSSLNSLLKSIQRRIDNIDRILSMEKTVAESL